MEDDGSVGITKHSEILHFHGLETGWQEAATDDGGEAKMGHPRGGHVAVQWDQDQLSCKSIDIPYVT